VADAIPPDLALGKAALAQMDYALAYSHFHPLAAAGNREAQRELGFLLMRSCFGDRTPALRWITRAAEAGDVPAAATLGRLYMNGDGVAQNDAVAFQWLSQAGKAGEASAEANLGVLYLNGRGVSLDRYQGIVWLVRAAEQGEASALASIGRAYSLGLALPKDERRALFWVAAAIPRASDIQRNQFATIFKNTVREVSPDDVRRIGREAEQWSPGPGRLDDVIADAARQRQFAPSVPPQRLQGPAARPPANPAVEKGKRSA
jgi:TPR repeat protein